MEKIYHQIMADVVPETIYVTVHRWIGSKKEALKPHTQGSDAFEQVITYISTRHEKLNYNYMKLT
jgi:hypothetical protein